MSRFIAAAIQMHSIDDKATNIAKAEALIDEAAAKGAKLVVLPEMFNLWGPPELLVEEAEPIPGPSVDRVRGKAKAHGIYIVAGSVAERREGEQKIRNTSVLVDPNGEIIARYSKIHLFDVEMPGQFAMRESDSVTPGDAVVVARTDHCTLGISICYDLRFPELYRSLVVAGANVVAIPGSFMLATGKDHWLPLIRARAIENQVYVVAANEFGPIPGTGALRNGRSVIVDPWGTVLAQAPDADVAIAAEIDLDYLQKVRRDIPCLTHLRSDVYSKQASSGI